MAAYIGYKIASGKYDIKYFWSQRKPTAQSHPQYAMVSGPFKNKKEAKEAYAKGYR